MKKNFSLTLLAVILSISAFALTPIYPHKGVCIGAKVTLSDTTSGGVWTSSNTSVATIDPVTGEVTGITAGSAVITYTLVTYVTSPITVAIAPAAIGGGASSICPKTSTTFTDATPGGIWSSTATYVATIGTTSGVAAGVAPGVTTISYTITSGCGVATTLTVINTPIVAIKGVSTLCVGASSTLTDSAGYTGTWSSSNTTVATISSGGSLYGVASGTAIISFTTTGVCGTTVGTKIVTITSTTSPGTISGTFTLTAGATATVYDAVPGGTWSSSNPSVGTIDITTGLWGGVAAGTATLSYTVSGCSGPAYATQAIKVNPFDGISGHVLFTGTPYYGAVKVYLITYDPGLLDLEAYDSTIVYSTGSSAYYQFSGVPTDSFRMKAAIDTPTIGLLGYIPTYHTSSFYWYAATVLPHVSGTSDINQDITMIYGTMVPGPGFIGGNVSLGANKGTSAGAAGLTMYAIDGSGNMAKTVTDGSGDYAFSNLPLGTYQIFPEALNYMTTPYAGITLTSGAPSKTTASFVQHTISMTITPNIELNANNVIPSLSSVSVFPNPSNGSINISWNEVAIEKGTVSVTDVTGRELYNATISMTQGAGATKIDLSNLANGTYMINVNAGSINYNNKIQIAH
ncbi:MAG: endo,4-beta-xylanase precursor [Flavipsychrobacter sp.]|nr:endo,4-beta-xylanase precursor [Flavipsychrobacter sp.]